jgi:hypothetical protein
MLPYPPPYQDRQTLAQHLCMGETTIDEYVAAGLLPRPRKARGTPLWEWDEVKVYIRGWPIAGPGAGRAKSPQGETPAPEEAPDQAQRVRLAAERAIRGSAA